MKTITRLFWAAATALSLVALVAPVGTRAQTSSSSDPMLTVRERRKLPVRLTIQIKERPGSRDTEYRGKIRVSDEHGESTINVPGENKIKSPSKSVAIVNDNYPLFIDRKGKAPAGFGGAFTISGELKNTTRGAKAYPVGSWSVTYNAKDLRRVGQRFVIKGDKADLIVTVVSQ
ncbi:MAG: hypothetical protein H7Y38_09780 [Armatimonadetes bacterium]|nr:hypothetical protein [Armatimonadota bacterium]